MVHWATDREWGSGSMQRLDVSRKRVLIVEDDYFLAHDIADSLADTGATVVGPVPSVKAALEILRSDLPDIAILDLMLDDETAYPIADVLRVVGVPIIFATAHSEAIPEEYREFALLEKPVDYGKLRQTINGLLARGSTDARGYGVRMAGDRWQWRVYSGDHVLAEGFEKTSVAARVAALQAATKSDLG